MSELCPLHASPAFHVSGGLIFWEGSWHWRASLAWRFAPSLAPAFASGVAALGYRLYIAAIVISRIVPHPAICPSTFVTHVLDFRWDGRTLRSCWRRTKSCRPTLDTRECKLEAAAVIGEISLSELYGWLGVVPTADG